MNPRITKWTKFIVRWGIAVAGIGWVVANIAFHDRVMVLGPDALPVETRVFGDANDYDSRFLIAVPNPRAGEPTQQWVSRDAVWTRPDRRSVSLQFPDGRVASVKLLAVHPSDHKLLVLDPATHKTGLQIEPSQVVGGLPKDLVPYPLVDIGLDRLVWQANFKFLLLALLVLPVTYYITSRRWHRLLEALDIHLTMARTFVLNMVGAFYNTFMPGSTGGDVIRAYYASKHTPHRVRAVLSVIVDRIIGLLALIILGGVMATFQTRIPACRRVAEICAAMLGMTAAGLVVFYHPVLRRMTGLDYLFKRLPMQKHVSHAVEALELYGQRPLVALGALLISFPVHITAIISATLIGLAFGLKMNLFYYWVCVPVIVLVGAIPISPQGAGVMEFFAVQLTKSQGVTVGQAVALAMSIRFGQMFWNLIAGVFVLRGGYHAPTTLEQEQMETDEGADLSSSSPVGAGNGVRTEHAARDVVLPQAASIRPVHAPFHGSVPSPSLNPEP